jgi:hypothetical protein
MGQLTAVHEEVVMSVERDHEADDHLVDQADVDERSLAHPRRARDSPDDRRKSDGREIHEQGKRFNRRLLARLTAQKGDHPRDQQEDGVDHKSDREQSHGQLHTRANLLQEIWRKGERFPAWACWRGRPSDEGDALSHT